MATPDGQCQRCLVELDPGQTFMADRDRVCDVCAQTARKRGEHVEQISSPTSQ